MGKNWNDSLDHVVTAVLAIVLSSGLFVLQLLQGAVPEWAIGALGTVLGFYFRGRVNGQYNSSQMGEIERVRKDVEHKRDEMAEAVHEQQARRQ